ncbi:hypothetical protein [Phaeodactylibacter luteus]|uniref:T9SS type A sorting domain-containing protein n=1 Tax=Phaeodactylibacter luteus TaxID=1564516 RepID=A0A5C6S470_9BACT|nr:hypothetical protein [Phaeodactylibacter luteus]TXB69420.1 hypothetical protein FRY97_01015 [Phaeodactylibacter luteus]
MKLAQTFLLLFSLFSASVYAQDVWPGDANNNGIVNAVDVLYIGLAYNATGPERTDATTNWEPQSFTLWPESFQDGTNFGYADCDGDGEIEDDDIENAIIPNFGLTHGTQSPDFYQNAAPGSGAPALQLVPSATLVEQGAQVDISLNLGSPDAPLADFYGIAFTLSYDTDLVEPTTGFTYDDVDDTFADADMAGVEDLFVNDEISGKAEFALTRINQQPISGSGAIASFSIIIEDIIVGLNVDTLNITIDSVLLINSSFKGIPVVPDTAQIIIARDTNLVSTHHTRAAPLPLRVFPNPARQSCRVALPQDVAHLGLYNSLGQLLWSASPSPGQRHLEIPLTALPSGLYHIRAKGREGRPYLQRLQVAP